MAKPVLMTVDDDPEVLRAVERDLRRHYAKDYRVVRAESGASALQALDALTLRNETVALFLVDQRMPHMSGVQFLEQAMQKFPDAKRVLLTAYADTDAAIRAINSVQIDRYILKPWDPPEDRLYPMLDDLLGDWQAGYRPPFEGVRVVGHRWSAKTHTVKDFLARNQVPYQALNLESDAEAAKLLDLAGTGAETLPVVLFPDGSHLVDPETPELAAKVGLSTRATQPFYDLVIVGGGPAGLAAAVYGASEGLRTLLIEREAPGGQAGQSSRIENYLGFPTGLSGADLARRAVDQARRFGVEMLNAQEVSGVTVRDPYRVVHFGDGGEVNCHALLITTGVSYRQLDVPGLDALTGAGVYYGAAMTEALSCRDEEVYIVGGANSAGQAAMYFSRYASKVIMLVRRPSLSATMSQYLIDQIGETHNIEVRACSRVVAVEGNDHLERITIADANTGEQETVPATSLFIFIGAQPRTDWLKDVVLRDENGFVLTGPDLPGENGRPPGWKRDRQPYLLETNVPGIFAAGDVRAGSVKRVATGVGEGALAVALIHRYRVEVGA